MSGLLAAPPPAQAGVAFVVVEKNDDVGGTWFENSYPGCRVDNPNHNYSYSFAQRHDWPLHFSTQAVLLDYFRRLRRRVRPARAHPVRHRGACRPTWSDDDAPLDGRACARPTATRTTLEADAVISAVGQLNRPHLPDIAGVDTFAGPVVPLGPLGPRRRPRGKRVAVIGTGASAVQFIPEIAADVGELLVFQRTPPGWCPRPTTTTRCPPGCAGSTRHVPSYSEWNRFWIFWKMGDGALASVRVDPDWDGNGDVGQRDQRLDARRCCTEYLEAEFADRPDLLEKVVPRPTRRAPSGSSATTASGPATLKRDNVAPASPSGIREITADGHRHRRRRASTTST